MGYYISVYPNIPLKEGLDPEKVNKKLRKDDSFRGAIFKEYINNENKNYKKYFLEFDEYYIRNFDIEDFGEKIKEYVGEGEIECIDEESNKIKITFDGKGNWDLEDAKEYYGEAYNHFLNSYDDIPDELKKRLQEWWLARGI